MACMAHLCCNPACHWLAFDNAPGPNSCPRCGGYVTHEYQDADTDRDDVEGAPEEVTL